MKKRKLTISIGVVLVIYAMMVFLRDSFPFEQIEVRDNQMVGETGSDFNSYFPENFYESI